MADAIKKLTADVGSLSCQVSTLVNQPAPRPQQAPRAPAPAPAGPQPTPSVQAQTILAPITYTQAMTQPATPQPSGGAPQTLAADKKKKKGSRQLLPPPKMYTKDPTLVLSTGNLVLLATARKSGASMTQTACEFFHSLPTTDQGMVLSCTFNVKGHIVTIFTQHPSSATPSTELIIDQHAKAFAHYVRDKWCTTGTSLPASLSLTASRVHLRASLHISRVPTQDVFGPTTHPFSATALKVELLQNHILKNLEFVVEPHYTITDGECLSSLDTCPVSFTFVNVNGSICMCLLKHPRVWLFGTTLHLSIPPVHQGLTQCEHCQALGHGTTGCHAPAVCTDCAGQHLTQNHWKSCADRTSEAIAKDTCPHLHCCHNCNGDHPATDPACPCKCRFCSILNGLHEAQLQELEMEL
ncbi:hypothetical protein M0805_008183 [Coniferiporia weirii]|nr:hypothetical protein M0805_008183 [Coniferiporia weirii]